MNWHKDRVRKLKIPLKSPTINLRIGVSESEVKSVATAIRNRRDSSSLAPSRSLTRSRPSGLSRAGPAFHPPDWTMSVPYNGLWPSNDRGRVCFESLGAHDKIKKPVTTTDFYILWRGRHPVNKRKYLTGLIGKVSLIPSFTLTLPLFRIKGPKRGNNLSAVPELC